MRQIAANCGNATDAQEKIREADAVAFISPVYWEEVSEGLKSFMDRFRR
ncbi:MAG: flavodoxin family protein, partial [Synergistaceae bacterium]|nr:flavodoxin family protein [Synergistaceae bacterium]